MAFDLSQGTNTNKIKYYINGNQLAASVFSTDQRNIINTSNPQAYGTQGVNLQIGYARGGQNYYDGYLAEVAYVDNQQYDPSYFAETKNGVWVPKDLSSGITWGTNGSWCKFENSGDLGNDSSGNNNDFTASGLGADHQVQDSPTFGS